MKVTGVCFLIVVLCSTLGEGKKQKKLEIISEHIPDDCSSQAAKGDALTVHYTGKLQSSGAVFDSSRASGREPFTVTLGAGQVIQGWDEGLVGMCEGEVRRLIIPSHLAYGDGGVPGTIPGGATLEFEVELLNLTKKPYFSMPQGGFLTAVAVVSVAVIVVYELYKRASRQGAELRNSKRKDKDGKRGGKGRKRKD